MAEVSGALIAMEKVSSTGQKSREDDSSAKTSESPSPELGPKRSVGERG